MRFAIPATTLLLALIAGVASAGEPIVWAKNLDQAYKNAKEQNRPMLIFIASSRCYYCDQMKKNTLADPAVMADLQSGFVPIIVQASKYPTLMRKLGVRRYPTTLIVSPEAKIQDVIDGYVKPREFRHRLEASQRETVASAKAAKNSAE